MSKEYRAYYYASKLSHLKQLKPKLWWAEVKRISGMTSPGPNNFLSHEQIDNFDNLSPTDFANLINNSFLRPMKDYRPLCDDDMLTLFLEITDDSPYIDTAITATVSIYLKHQDLMESPNGS